MIFFFIRFDLFFEQKNKSKYSINSILFPPFQLTTVTFAQKNIRGHFSLLMMSLNPGLKIIIFFHSHKSFICCFYHKNHIIYLSCSCIPATIASSSSSSSAAMIVSANVSIINENGRKIREKQIFIDKMMKNKIEQQKKATKTIIKTSGNHVISTNIISYYTDQEKKVWFLMFIPEIHHHHHHHHQQQKLKE